MVADYFTAAPAPCLGGQSDTCGEGAEGYVKTILKQK